MIVRRLKKLLSHRQPEPEYINGRRVRRGMVTCPACSAPPREWCYNDCPGLDLMDYR